VSYLTQWTILEAVFSKRPSIHATPVGCSPVSLVLFLLRRRFGLILNHF